ncbi:MAG: Folylpolyglutamate synthase [Verrucomicrobia subdivision 3 bacterium]|nr:Folylpolyglutamate synthase [Limisphaerales bacterium]MCS1415881.1 Folylpolyglutamate synthase [Limisphaerales bacterium]
MTKRGELEDFRTPSDAIHYLYDLRLFGTKLGLDNPRRLAACFDNPQEDLNFIHVAGTNGKGSVCAMLENIYRTAGYRVGLFTSPHLVDFRERIQVNREWLPEQQMLRLVSQTREALARFDKARHPTFFEVVVILALLHFRESQCDLVIWETGMGGRLDATNIVTPQLSIITNVDLDHQKWLGDTIKAIAWEKAGIIKPSVPSLSGATNEEAESIIRNRAAEIQSPHQHLSLKELDQFAPDFEIALPGHHQKRNASLVIKSTEILERSFPISPEALRLGLRTADWPGRIQVFQHEGQTIVLDGAHNEPSIAALCAHLEEAWPNTPKSVLLGALEDKGIERWLKFLVHLSKHFFLAPVKSARSIDPTNLAAQIAEISGDAETAIFDSFDIALQSALGTTPILIICGSLYLIGEALASFTRIALEDTHTSLNDWEKAAKERRTPKPVGNSRRSP